MPIRITIIEDHEFIRKGLEYILSASGEFELAGSFSTAEEALDHFKNVAPDIILMDINLPGMSGIECTRIVKSQYPEALVMMCTVYEDDEKIFRALSAGASGYVLKNIPPEQFVDSIKELVKGGSPMSSQIARKVVNYLQHVLPDDDGMASLSDREREVIDLLASGYRNKEIAEKLFISLSTVKSHIYKIYEKLHVSSRVEALNKINKIKR